MPLNNTTSMLSGAILHGAEDDALAVRGAAGAGSPSSSWTITCAAPPSVPAPALSTAQKTSLDILRLYSRRRGHAHEAAADGAEAVARFREAAATERPVALVLVRRSTGRGCARC
jgi:hypothetical protein